MGHMDRTTDFRGALASRQHLTSSKRRKVSGDDSPPAFGKEYLREAYAILNHINVLSRMLAFIRKPYLSVDSPPTALGWRGPRNLDIGNLEETWSEIKHLTNEERDQVDLQARVILSRCADRVKAMEALEKRAVVLNSLRIKLIQSHDFFHITWYLNRRLAETSQNQKSMQEERVKRQLERTRTLGSSAAREAMTIGAKNFMPDKRQAGSDSWLEGASSVLVSGFAATIGAATHRTTDSNRNSASIASTDDETDNEDIELTQSQILQFETENANILRSVQDTLESVQQAEARLMDISNLQMELVTHLTRQTELTDQLYEDAMATTSTVEKGNVQLREARRRAKDSRLFVLVFLVGASLSLLFLHFY
ncbi:hypothetical protein ID866_3764 [Astraeus odoratus]|nr:hypothetical protein ID866_3764 [Astraeus odoratus]